MFSLNLNEYIYHKLIKLSSKILLNFMIYDLSEGYLRS
jgi:hypothetical protein